MVFHLNDYEVAIFAMMIRSSYVSPAHVANVQVDSKSSKIVSSCAGIVTPNLINVRLTVE